MICTELIKKGTDETELVKAIKVRLNTLLKANLDPQNGNFGLDTEAAVRLFQRQNNLLDDGVVGQLTWERLFTERPVIKPTGTELRYLAVEIMKTQLHVRERTGNNDGAEVEEYLRAVGLGKGYAWCVAFPYWAFLKASERLKIKNLMPKTAGVLDLLKKSKPYVISIHDEPQYGDLGVMDFGEGKGHLFMVTEKKDKYVYTVEGNTSADPTYKAQDREGNGVFERKRSISVAKAFIRFV